MRVIVTRPKADSERTAAALRARGHEVLVAPLMRVEPIATDFASGWSGIVITSANAPAAIAKNSARDRLIKLPVYAVGRRSADAARRAGFADVISAGGDVRDLVQLIAEQHADASASLLYLAGEDRAADLVAELAVHGIAAQMAVVYRAVANPFPPALMAAFKASEVDAVLHFSKRSAENYLAGARRARIADKAVAVRHLCLSQKIAAPLAAAGAKDIAVAKRADEAELLELVEAGSH